MEAVKKTAHARTACEINVCNESDFKPNFASIITADAEGVMFGISQNGSIRQKIVYGIAFGAVFSIKAYKEQQNELLQELPLNDITNLSVLIQQHPDYVNIYHPVSNNLYLPREDSIMRYGYWHNTLITNLYNSGTLTGTNSPYEIFSDISQQIDYYFSDSNLNWDSIYNDIFLANSINEPILSLESQNLIALHNHYLGYHTIKEYITFREHLVDSIPILDISNEEKELLTAYLSTALSSYTLWRPIVPFRGTLPCIIATATNYHYITDETTRNIFELSDDICPLYCIYGPNRIEALCFYDQENSLFGADDEYLDFSSQVILPSNIEAFEFDTIPQGRYPIHQTISRIGLNYILLNERIN